MGFTPHLGLLAKRPIRTYSCNVACYNLPVVMEGGVGESLR
jgi:hypothetical protein